MTFLHPVAILSGKKETHETIMGKSCCAIGCTNRWVKGCGISFYRFPTDPARRARWISAVNRKNWAPAEHSWLCSAHFVSGRKHDDKLSPDYVPSLFDYVPSPVKRKREGDLVAYFRRKEARLKRDLAVANDANDDDVSMETSSDVATVTEQPSRCEVATQTDLSMQVINSMENENCQLNRENSQLRESIRLRGLNKERLSSNDSMVKFYTGLPSFTVLMAIFNFIAPYMPQYSRTVLSTFQQFIMTLMKLRLNLFDQDIAYRFEVSQSTVSKNFRKWINAMCIRLKPLVKWPAREQLLKTMPLDFKLHFRKCVCIIDCFEVFCERLKDLKARAQTYSNYKHHNTVKFLIGITPQGVISYVSKGWGGRVSDKHLTENCGILKLLLPGDQVLADRGFNVQDSVGLYCAEITIPPFTKGKKQLSKLEIDSARQLSRVRIHVERVIGLLRQKYTILESTLPINMIMCDSETDCSMIDKIVNICCALCNCSESVVPFQ